ncbi:MAG: flippase-like domain-containing protein [Anaerolineae bacterium]|nr:flippase-like domain-containing protein [Anaerolineae bacterium]
MASDSPTRHSQGLRWAASLALVALCSWLLARDLDWRAVAAGFSTARYGWVLVGGLCIVATFFTRARRWQMLLQQPRIRLRPVMTALLVGQALNMALPMRGGDVARAAWIGRRRTPEVARALASVAVEKAWDLLALLACCLALLAVVPLPAWFARSAWGAAATLALVALSFWAVLHWRSTLFHWAERLLARLPAVWSHALLPHLDRAIDGLESLRRPDLAARVALWTALTWALGGLANLVVLAAFGIPSPGAALFLLAALMAGAAIPLSIPGQLGVFEGICVASLALFGVPRGEALAVGLALHAVVMGPALLAAALLVVTGGAGERA